MSQCWICNAHANSGEHMIKKSDLKRSMRGAVNQETPIYHRVSGENKRPIGSLNSEALKFDKSICVKCNGSLTQPHDNAWSALSNYLNSTHFDTGSEIELSNVFDSDINSNLRNVHLFFAKIFGCKLVETELQFDLNILAQSIMTNTYCPHLYIKLRNSNNERSDSYCALSDIQVSRDTNGNLQYAHLYYTVGKYTIDIVYSEDTVDLELTDYFQPNDTLTKITIGGVDYRQGYKADSTN